MAHYHLWCAFRDELKEKKWAKKMCYALFRMKRQVLKSGDVETLAKMYEEARTESLKELHYSNLGSHRSEETKMKMSESQKGRVLSEETRMKISVSRIGKTSWNKGKSMREESRKKLSETNKKALKGMGWWNNGEVCVRSEECPEGFVRGRLTMNGMQWFNNGVKETYADVCPEGFVKGRLKGVCSWDGLTSDER